MIYKIVNKDKLNFFNPTYEYYIYETMIDFDLDFLKQFILQKENEICYGNSYYYYDSISYLFELY